MQAVGDCLTSRPFQGMARSTQGSLGACTPQKIFLILGPLRVWILLSRSDKLTIDTLLPLHRALFTQHTCGLTVNMRTLMKFCIVQAQHQGVGQSKFGRAPAPCKTATPCHCIPFLLINKEFLCTCFFYKDKLKERLDFMLRESLTESSYLNSITAHCAYWTSQDCAMYVLLQIYKSKTINEL